MSPCFDDWGQLPAADSLAFGRHTPGRARPCGTLAAWVEAGQQLASGIWMALLLRVIDGPRRTATPALGPSTRACLVAPQTPLATSTHEGKPVHCAGKPKALAFPPAPCPACTPRCMKIDVSWYLPGGGGGMPGSVWDGDTTRPWQQADLCNDGLGSNLARCSHPSSLPFPPLPAPLPIPTLPSCCLHFLGACACWYQGGSLDGISFGGQARDSEDSGCGQPFVDGPLRWLYNASPCQRVSALAGGRGCGLPNGEKRCRVHMPVAAWVPPRPCSAAASAHTLPLPARPQDTLLTPPSSMGAFGIPTVSTSPACASFVDFAPDVILHVHTRRGSLGSATIPTRRAPAPPPGPACASLVW